MKKILLEITAFVLTLTILISASMYLGYLYMPERNDTGATWNMYLEEPEESIDILFVGSSLAYCDIIPAQIYQKTGYTSYVMAAPYMKPDVAYYYLKEALRTQSPDVVMLEATSFFFSDKEADYYKVNIGYMPYSINRLEATFAAPAQYRMGLLFPLYNYHDRWQSVPPSTYFTGRSDAHTDPLAGYTMLDTCKPQERRFERTFLADESELAENFSYLQKIIDLCAQYETTLELFVVPACEYVSQEHILQLQQVAGSLPIIDFNQSFAEMGLDPATDFFDSRHVNYRGAVKFTDYLTDYITRSFTLPSHAHDTALWQDRVAHLDTLQMAS